MIKLAGCQIVLPRESETVLLGAAILGAVAAKKYTGLHEAMRALNAAGQVHNSSINTFLSLFCWSVRTLNAAIFLSYFLFFKLGLFKNLIIAMICRLYMHPRTRS